MHTLIYEFLQDAQPGHALTRLPLDDGALLALFAHESHPRWVAKTAANDAGLRRLRREAWALGVLEPWAQRLGLPRLLGWLEEGGESCLIQSGIPGRPLRDSLSTQSAWATLPPSLAAALAWLPKLHCLVPAPGPDTATLRTLIEDRRAQVECDLARDLAPGLAPGQGAAPALLAALLPALETPRGNPPALVAAHGDYWCGNLMVSPAAAGECQLGVTDWSGLHADTALDDLFTLFAHLLCRRRWQWVGGLDAWQWVFFANARPRHTLREFASGAGYSDTEARAAFYLFLIRRLRWELGMDLQTRSPAERAQAERDWTARIAWLKQHRMPDPFTPMPV